MTTTLVLRRGGLGDTLLMLPVLRALRREAPGGLLHFAGVREFADVLAAFCAVDRALSSEDLSLWAPERARQRLRGYTRLVADDGAAAALAAPGTAVQVFDLASRGGRPFGRQLAERLGLTVRWPDDALLVPQVPRPSGGTVVLAPGSGGQHKLWPREGWLQLAARLADAGPAPTVLVGPTELEREDPRRWPWPAGTAFLAGRTPVELAHALQLASRVVGNDSGPVHLAAMLGVPTVAIFGPTDPGVWAPPGAHVRIVGAMGRPLAGITVDEVLVACG